MKLNAKQISTEQKPKDGEIYEADHYWYVVLFYNIHTLWKCCILPCVFWSILVKKFSNYILV